MPDTVPLREFLEQRIQLERAITDQRFELTAHALQLQALEVERRLTSLNHAHAQQVIESARVLPRELHDAFIKEYDTFRYDTTRQLQAVATRSATWTAAVGVLFILVSLIIRFWPTT